MSLVPNLALSGASANQGYVLSRSLRFRLSASAYLNRTPASSTNQTTWSWSGWVKRGSLGSTKILFSSYASAGYYTYFGFNTSDQLLFQNRWGTDDQVFTTTQVFRDPSAWYHIVLSIDLNQATGTNGIKMYVNSVQITSFGTTTYTNTYKTTAVNGATYAHNLSRDASSSSNYFDGYLSEVNFIDGQALTPSSFGQTDPVSGVWQPIKYAGTYGTNGFYLPFTDNTSATTLAYDKSGNGNNWTANNISTTAGSTYDSMTDVPTLTSATAANFAVMNPLDKLYNGATFSSGNLNISYPSTVGTNCARSNSTIAIQSGSKVYFEIVSTTTTYPLTIGIAKVGSIPTSNQYLGYGADEYSYLCGGGNKFNNNTSTAYGAAITSGDVLGCAVDLVNGKIWWSKNGTWQASGDPVAGTNPAFTGLIGDYYACVATIAAGNTCTGDVNFGQRPFSYTPPTGFVALNTFNLPDPTIKKPNQYMDATLYVGNAGTKTVTNSGFQPDLVWMKDRTTAYDHVLLDAVRAGTPPLYLSSNLTSAEGVTGGGETMTYNSNGFTYLGNNFRINANTDNYVAWQWKESATAGFDIVTYTGTGANRTVSHNLGVAPKLIYIKRRDSTSDWSVYYNIDGLGAGVRYLQLNTTAAGTYDTTYWNSTAATSSVFSLGTATAVNTNGGTYVAYLFAEIAGYSKFGSYTGNGSADGPFVYCGFRPKYVLMKYTSGAGDWCVWDSVRDPENFADNVLYPDLAGADGADANMKIDIVSNGFKIRGLNAQNNASGGTYIYAAFAENPYKYALGR